MNWRSFLFLAAAGALVGDTLVLKGGKAVDGTYLGGDPRQVKFAVGDKVQTYDIGDVESISFRPLGGPKELKSTAVGTTRVTDSAVPSGTIPAGSALVVRLIDAVDSDKDDTGRQYRASVDEAIVVNGATVVAKGTDVTVKLIEDKQSGRFTGKTELTLAAVDLTVGGRRYDLTTSEVTQASDSRTASTAKRTGGLAAAGAVIGAIAGGGKGAAIGAAAGAGAGAATQIITKGAKVRIPSETRLSFTIKDAVRL